MTAETYMKFIDRYWFKPQLTQFIEVYRIAILHTYSKFYLSNPNPLHYLHGNAKINF